MITIITFDAILFIAIWRMLRKMNSRIHNEIGLFRARVEERWKSEIASHLKRESEIQGSGNGIADMA